jgi:hypothetical protein
MNRPGFWIAAVTVVLAVLACDPKTPKPTDPPKPVVNALKMT